MNHPGLWWCLCSARRWARQLRQYILLVRDSRVGETGQHRDGFQVEITVILRKPDLEDDFEAVLREVAEELSDFEKIPW